MKMRVLPIFLAFLAMGFGDAVGPFVGLAKNEFALSNTMAFLIPFMGFIMFGILSVPVGIFQDKKGKKFVQENFAFSQSWLSEISANINPEQETQVITALSILMQSFVKDE